MSKTKTSKTPTGSSTASFPPAKPKTSKTTTIRAPRGKKAKKELPLPGPALPGRPIEGTPAEDPRNPLGQAIVAEGLAEADETDTIERMAEERHEAAAAARPTVEETDAEHEAGLEATRLLELAGFASIYEPEGDSAEGEDLLAAARVLSAEVADAGARASAIAVVLRAGWVRTEPKAVCPACDDPTLGVHTCGKVVEAPAAAPAAPPAPAPIVVEAKPETAELQRILGKAVADLEYARGQLVAARTELDGATSRARIARKALAAAGVKTFASDSPRVRILFEVSLEEGGAVLAVAIAGRPETRETFPVAGIVSASKVAYGYVVRRLGGRERGGVLVGKIRTLLPQFALPAK